MGLAGGSGITNNDKLNRLLAGPTAPTPPGPAPDLTNAAVLAARRSQLNQLLAQRGRASTFLGAAPTDYLNQPGTGAKTLLGG